MLFYNIMGCISTIALAGPVLFIIFCRLSFYKTFPLLLIYYANQFLFNLITLGIIQPDPVAVHNYGYIANLLDAPVMMLFLSMYAPTRLFSRRLKWGVLGLLVFDLAVLLITGYSRLSNIIVVGTGITVMIFLGLYVFRRQAKTGAVYRKNPGRLWISAAVTFTYCAYAIVYTLFYLTPLERVDYAAFILFFFSTFFSTTAYCVGIYHEGNRVKKLKELKLSRRELHEIYKAPKKAIRINPVQTALLDFDKDLWN
jgi:uncharacterized membrane protein YuzA (DUF378 family)